MDQFKSLLPEKKSVSSLDDLRNLTVKELRVILAAYKEKMSGSKADLILRAYAILSRMQEDDSTMCSAAQVEEANEDHCTYESIFKNKCSHLPWTSDLRGTPIFSFVQLYDYLVIRTTKFKHIKLKSTAYKRLKSFQFFYEGYIRSFSVAKDLNYTYFDVRMKASMKNTLYKVIVVLSNDSGDVSSAACTCPAGAGVSGFGNCNHVGGVLFALEDFNRKGYQSCPEPVSCTSKLSAWNVPSSSSKIAPASIDQIVIKKIKFGKDNSSITNPQVNHHDPRKSKDRQLHDEHFEKLRNSIASSTPISCFFAFHPFPETQSSSDTSVLTETVNSLDSPFENLFVQLSVSNDADSVPFTDDYDISCSNFKEMMEHHAKSHMILSPLQICEIEKSTRGQSENDSWKQHRLYRITASNFYSAAVNTVEPSSKLKSMFYSSFSSTATQHGKLYEPHVRSLYLDSMIKKGYHNISVDEPGLIISKSHSFLGASLDGIVHHNDISWGLEIKCPFSKFSASLEAALDDKSFFLTRTDEKIHLKKKNRYHYQIQGQMFCSGLKRVDLVVWFGDHEPLFIESINYDANFVERFILPQLHHFYCKAVLPEYFTKRVKRGLPLYIHGGWEKFSS